MDIKFSVVTATYNRKKYVRRTIESIMGQEYSNWELIVVDDGSTDGTSEVFEEIKDSRIIYIRYDENRGPSYARNRGIEAAIGEYLFLLDSDDCLSSNALEDIYKVIMDTNGHYNEYNFVVVDMVTGIPYNKNLPPDRTEITYSDNLSGKYPGDYCHVTKRIAFQHIKFPVHIRGGEHILWHHISKEFGPALFINLPVKEADRSSPDSLTKKIGAAEWNAWNNMYLTAKEYLNEFGEDLARVNYEKFIENLQRYAATALVCRQYSEAIRITKKLIVLQSNIIHYALFFLACSRNRLPLIIYHKSKRFLKAAKRFLLN